jgi:hypothetical protein
MLHLEIAPSTFKKAARAKSNLEPLAPGLLPLIPAALRFEFRICNLQASQRASTRKRREYEFVQG